jgi:hypothetical protein
MLIGYLNNGALKAAINGGFGGKNSCETEITPGKRPQTRQKVFTHPPGISPSSPKRGFTNTQTMGRTTEQEKKKHQTQKWGGLPKRTEQVTAA